MTDARSLLREATAERLRSAAAECRFYAGQGREQAGRSLTTVPHANRLLEQADHLDLAAAALELVAEGRESGAFADALHYRRGEWSDDDELLLRTLAGEP